MQNTKKIIQNINKSDYFNKVNLHIHSTCSDGELSPKEILNQAQSLGLEVISITDHNTIDAYKELDFEKTKDITIIKGVEFDCWYGYTLLHILGYGIDINNKAIQKICSQDKRGTSLDIIRFFNRRKAKDVIKAIKSAGGIPVLAHPACCWNLSLKNMVKNLKSYGLEGIESYYLYRRHRAIIKFHTEKNVKKIAKELSLIETGGTDCHESSLFVLS